MWNWSRPPATLSYTCALFLLLNAYSAIGEFCYYAPNAENGSLPIPVCGGTVPPGAIFNIMNNASQSKLLYTAHNTRLLIYFEHDICLDARANLLRFEYLNAAYLSYLPTDKRPSVRPMPSVAANFGWRAKLSGDNIYITEVRVKLTNYIKSSSHFTRRLFMLQVSFTFVFHNSAIYLNE